MRGKREQSSKRDVGSEDTEETKKIRKKVKDNVKLYEMKSRSGRDGFVVILRSSNSGGIS